MTWEETVTTPPPYDLVDGLPDFDTVYTRCPTCGVIAAAGSADHRLTVTGELDPADDIRLSCRPGAHRYSVTTAVFLGRDAVGSCVRCSATFPCPAEADEVVCPECRLHQPGPFLDADPARGAYVAQVHGAFAARAQQRLRFLRDRP
jgi:DNA-directed RNA polymerase subunit RPC12/RpoP